MAFADETLSKLLRKAERYRCNVRSAQARDGGRYRVFCPPGFGVTFDAVPTALHTVRNLQVDHVVPYRLNPQLKETPLAARDFEDKWPQCKFNSAAGVIGSRVSVVNFNCGDMPVYEVSEMLDWLYNSAKYAVKVGYDDPDRRRARRWGLE